MLRNHSISYSALNQLGMEGDVTPSLSSFAVTETVNLPTHTKCWKETPAIPRKGNAGNSSKISVGKLQI